ncbi:AAA family ATPase [Streptomyces sp. NPDC048411]|uniref:helix-turn-helix transcriptional regulator n=1 Tax=Streptomyces sp. NPDC048411 TaxID=3157206 RepID=UPI0034555F67
MSLTVGQPGRSGELVGRSEERARLALLMDAVRAGASQALVVHGDPGIGKSALLDHLTDQAVGYRVLRVVGVQSEMELVFAGLHQLCAPLMGLLDRLPVPQRDALRTAFGLSDAAPPQLFLVGLAVLGLLSEAAEEQPLLCVVDDHHWLDRASSGALGFVARRLAADPVGLVFGTRTPGGDLAGVPELRLTGLPDGDARDLLHSVLSGPLDKRVRDQVVAESGGNPLALLEWLRGATWTRLAGEFGLPDAVSLSGRLEEGFRRGLAELPSETRHLLLLAAAEPSGEASRVWRAAAQLGIRLHAVTPAVEAGLVDMATRVRFRHPLLRSAAYQLASAAERQEAHLALVEATDPQTDPDRRAWHRAQAAAGPDEEVAAELEASAGRALARGGLAASAAFLRRAVLLSDDPVRRTERILAAAETSLQAGAFDTALDLLATTQAGALDKLQGARVDLLRAHVSLASASDGQAPSLLLEAARRLEPLDRDLARDTYMTAWMAAVFTDARTAGTDIGEILRAAQHARPAEKGPATADRLLDAFTLMFTAGPAEAAPALREIVAVFTGPNLGATEALRLGWFAQSAASALWDHEAWHAILTRQVRLAREAGALDRLPIMLACLGVATVWQGDFVTAATLVAESDAVCGATGTTIAPFTAALLGALRGDEDEALPLITAAAAEAHGQGQGVAEAYANWTGAILHNGLGHYDQALALAAAAAEDSPGRYVSLWALTELIEAAVAIGQPEPARDALDQLARSTQASGTDFALGVEARSRALLSTGDDAETLYREAIDRLGRTTLRPELARAHLLYGEWLRRENRRADARAALRTAHDMLADMGVAAFAERARRELMAIGERVRRPSSEATVALTAQEALIARLAADGRTNPEIGAQLFISARTVEWHLRKIFTKLDIRSRRELAAALAQLG